MRLWNRSIACALLILPVGFAGQTRAQDGEALPEPLQSPQAVASYGIGMQLGRQLAGSGFDQQSLDVNSLARGIADAIAGADPQISPEQFQDAMKQIQQIVEQRMQQRGQAAADRGLKFLTSFKAREGVQALPSGLLYKVVKEGSGASPTATDRVKTHYRGRLVDGTEFDSSYKRNEPAEFALNQVIPGWTEALQKMKVGGKWVLAIPSELAYGQSGRPPVIGPNEVLVFEIELLDILPPSP